MARNTPKVKNGIVECEGLNDRVVIDSPEWFEWLDQVASFSYEATFNSFTLHKRGRSGSLYWYAYRRCEGRLKTLYAGKTADLCQTRLEELAQQFEGKTASAQKDYLLDTKSFLPPDPTGLVSRARLLEKLNMGSRLKLILVVAPPGYGKTTLLAEWAKTDQKQVAWVALDETDNDPARFVSYLTAALAPFVPRVVQDQPARLKAPSLEMELAATLEAATRITTETFLVLDDFHFIEAAWIVEQVSSLLAQIPPHLHLIISSRTVPALPLGKLRAKNQLLELKVGDLWFTNEEGQEFFNSNSNSPFKLNQEQVHQLWERCEGWATGLQLAALALQGRDGNWSREFIRTFNGSQRYIFEYLGEEILSRQTEDMRHFLLATSILSRLNAGLCEYVTGQSGGQQRLEQLEKANLFMVPLDDVREWYRYHHLFAQFLQTRLQQSAGEIDLLELNNRAAIWYEQHNMANEAVKHVLAVGNFENAVRLVEANGRKLLVRGEIATLKLWLEALPAELVSLNYELDLLYTWVQAISGQLPEAEARFNRLEKSLPVGEAQAIRLVLTLQKGNLEEIYQFGQLIVGRQEEPDPFIRSVEALIVGMMQDFFGNSTQATQAYLSSSLFGEAVGNTLLVQVATAQVGDILFLEGQLHRAAETYRRAINPFPQEEKTGNGLLATSLVYQGYSMVLYELNELDEAARLLEEAIKLNSTFAYHLVLGACLAQLALVREAQGDHQSAQAAIVQATEAVYHTGLAWLAGYTEMLLARINLKLGNLSAVHTWARAFPSQYNDVEDVTPFISFMNVMSQMILSKLYLKEGKPSEALKLLEWIEPEAAKRNWVKWLVEIQTLRAAALRAAGKERAALLKLGEALKAGEKEGFIRSFADHSDVLGDLLEKASKNLDPVYRRKLLKASGIARLEASQSEGGHLSARELEVLKLAASGISNEEIARELMVATSTVKTHLLHVYDKLDAHNRSQAAACARELGLI